MDVSEEKTNLIDSDRDQRPSQQLVLRSSSAIRLGALVTLTLQTSLFTLTRRYSQAVLGETYSSGSVIFISEILKLAIAIYGCFLSNSSSFELFQERMVQNLVTILPMTLPAVIYLFMNMMSFYALSKIDAATFSVIFQLKLVTTAFFSRTLLKTQFSRTQYFALGTVVLGVIQITLSTLPHSPCHTRLTSQDHHHQRSEDSSRIAFEYYKGVAASLVEVTLSGVCTVYMEKMFKTHARELSIWDRNIQLSISTMPVCWITVLIAQEHNQGFFHGWSGMAVFLACLNAFGGISVALCLKYADAVLKTFATTGAIIITTVASFVFLEGPMNSSIIIASGVVILGVMNH
jgi:UDP-sugar transporter A1/2/3